MLPFSEGPGVLPGTQIAETTNRKLHPLGLKRLDTHQCFCETGEPAHRRMFAAKEGALCKLPWRPGLDLLHGHQEARTWPGGQGKASVDTVVERVERGLGDKTGC